MPAATLRCLDVGGRLQTRPATKVTCPFAYKGQHHVVERADWRELVAVHLLVKPEDRAYGLSAGFMGAILAEIRWSHTPGVRLERALPRGCGAPHDQGTLPCPG